MPPRRTMLGSVASAILGACLALGAAAPAAATIDKCQGGINKVGLKLEGKIFKALGKCKDAYRKGLVKGAPIAGPGFAAAKCQLLLNKTIAFPDTTTADGISAMQAAQTALAALRNPPAPPAACDDADLVALGHLPEGAFGDRWQRLVLIAKLQSAYEQQIGLVRDTPDVFRSLDVADCPLCGLLVDPPCLRHTCLLGTGTTSNTQTFVNGGGPVSTTALNGEAIFALCKVPWIFGNDLAVIGRPAKGFKPATVPGGTACISGIAAEGYVNCGSLSPRVNTQTCQDHVVNAPEADDCAAAGFTTCQPAAADLVAGDPTAAANTHVASTNGGACLKATTVPPTGADAFVLHTMQITHVSAAQVGPDGLPCTQDDTATPGTPTSIPLTTGTAQAFVFDLNNLPGANFNTTTITGTPFNCLNLLNNNLSPGKLVGALAGVHSLCFAPPCDKPDTSADEGAQPVDTATTLVLTCQ